MLFQPSNIYPSTFSGIGAGTVDVTQDLNVSWQVNGDTPMTAYQIKIYQNDSGSTLMYDSGSVSVSPVFEPHDKYGNATYFTAIISAAALSTAGIVNGYQYGYKMLITQWWGVSDYVEQTSASVFITRSTPTLAINTITTPVASNSLTITANYSQAQGDPISTVEWVFALAGSESTPIRKTGAISTQVLSFDADGLITGNTYSIMCKVVTSTGMEASTGFVQFPVSYSSSSLGINYQLAQLKNSSAVYLSWDDLGSNKLAYPYTDTTKTTNGITFTVNGEGDVVATGTASADAYFTIAQGTLSQLGITAGQKFIVTSGYSGAKIVVTETNSSNVVVSTITGNDPLQYIATSTTNTLKFSIVIPSGSVLSSGQQLQPMIAIEDKIVALNDLSVTMQPIQDLHGYSSPWPAGGGVNILPPPTSATAGASGTITDNNGLLTISTTGEDVTFTIRIPEFTFAESGQKIELLNSFTNGTVYFLNGSTQIDYFSLSFVNRVVSESSMSTLKGKTIDRYRIAVNAQTLTNATFAMMVTDSSASALTAFSPYSNICPISGLTGLSVYNDPKYGGTIEFNQKFPTKTLSYVGTNYTITSNNDGKFTVNATATASQSTSVNHTNIGASAFTAGHVYAWIGNSDKIKVDLKVYAKNTDTIFKATTASYSNIVFLFDNLTVGTYEVFPQLFDLTEMFGQQKAEEVLSAEQSSTGSGVAWFRNLFYKTYYPVNAGETTCVSAVNGDLYWKKDIDWSTQAGTVYSGTLDVVTGQLTVDMASVDLGTLTWGRNWAPNADPTGVFYSSIISNIDTNKSGICTSYAYATGNPNAVPDKSFTMYVYGGSGRIYVKDTSYDDATNFKTAVSGVIVVYELATPLTYQLTPTQIAVLTGTNNVWSTGDSVSVTYTKDTGSQATLSGAIVTFSDSNAVLIPTPQYIPGITGISIYRYLQGESALQHVYDLATGATSILDYYAPSQMQVSYLIVAHSGIGDLFLQTTKFTPTFWFFSILLCDTDSNGDYHVSKEYIFKYGVETGAVSNNNDPTIQKNFTPYPNRQPISTLYKTGKISGYIGKTNNLNRYSDSISLQNAIYDISVSSLDKFLKSRKGDVIKVDTASSIQMKTEDNTVQQALKATVDWVEVGEASQVSIVSVPSDSFWPIS